MKRTLWPDVPELDFPKTSDWSFSFPLLMEPNEQLNRIQKMFLETQILLVTEIEHPHGVQTGKGGYLTFSDTECMNSFKTYCTVCTLLAEAAFHIADISKTKRLHPSRSDHFSDLKLNF